MNNTSFDKIVEKTFDNFKKITPALLAIAGATAMVLFMPTTFLEKLEMNDIPTTIKLIIGIIFIISVALILAIAITSIYSVSVKNIKCKKAKRELHKRVERLNNEQVDILVKLLSNSEKRLVLEVTSGNTEYLVANGFIYQPEQFLEYKDAYKNVRIYVARPWLIDYYERKPNKFKKKNY